MSDAWLIPIEENVFKLEERIRELEAENHDLKALIVGGENWAEKGAAAHLAQRIAKAREILLTGIDGYARPIITKALAALEGK